MTYDGQRETWLSRVLAAFASWFRPARARSHAQQSSGASSRKLRHVAGHWPVWIELGATTREARKPTAESLFTLRFGAQDAALLRTLKITSRDFTGHYVLEKKSFVVQVPETLVSELMRRQDLPVYIEGFIDGESVGSRRFNIPLTF